MALTSLLKDNSIIKSIGKKQINISLNETQSKVKPKKSNNTLTSNKPQFLEPKKIFKKEVMNKWNSKQGIFSPQKERGDKNAFLETQAGSQNENSEKFNFMDVVEKQTAHDVAINLLKETLDMLDKNKYSSPKEGGKEKYELIDKEEFEKLKQDNLDYKKRRLEVHEEYKKLDEECKKVTSQLEKINFDYYKVEKERNESATKVFQMEEQLKEVIMKNTNLQNEIKKEIESKNNVFRALNEIENKYTFDCPEDLKSLFKKIKDDNYAPVVTMNQYGKIGYLEHKIEELKKEESEKSYEIKKLKEKIKGKV